MMWGAAGQCFCYIFISGLLSQTGNPDDGRKYGAGATAFFFLYYVFFGICWQVCPDSPCLCVFCGKDADRSSVSGCTVALSSRNQLLGHAHQGSGIGNREQLDRELHCRADHPDGHSPPWLAVLFNMDGVQCHFRSCA